MMRVSLGALVSVLPTSVRERYLAARRGPNASNASYEQRLWRGEIESILQATRFS